jgi:cytochrome c oxidase subunit 2
MNLAALDHAGAGADAITQLSWLLLVACAIVYVLALAAFAWSMLRQRDAADPATPDPARDRRGMQAIALAIGASVLVLSGLVVASYRTDRALIALEEDAPVQIEITARQWWWEVRYLDPQASKGFVTAHELHLPVNVPVAVKLQSTDVIHSLWIPELDGKRDIIPGRTSVLHLLARTPGRWQGRCAEFCGYQHAHMNITAVAESQEAFDAWRAAQAAPARPPQDEAPRRGEQVFSGGRCVSCHVVRGTSAAGYSSVAPDLTHLMSRRFLAAGTLPNTRENLAQWIVSPHSVKPGVHMPANALSDADRDALLAFLLGLT